MIDVHQHVNWLGKNDRELMEYLDRVGVDKCWLLSWESIDGGRESMYQHLSIEDVRKTYKKYPKRIIPFCGVDPRRENAEKILRDLHKRGFKGYGEIKFRILADNPDLIRMLRLAGRLKMPALLHFDVPLPCLSGWYLGDITHLENAARLCPGTILIGHGPGFWREVSGNAPRSKALYPKGRVTPGGRIWKVLAKYPNIYADLSANSGLTALSRDRSLAKRMLTRFRKKILYGTDCYDTKLLEFLRSLDLAPGVFRDITERNAKRLVRK
jgi:predicted TIM-barrel fold metal-dependent hydrolase